MRRSKNWHSALHFDVKWTPALSTGVARSKNTPKGLGDAKKAVILAEKLGIRNIQMAGYDVFYEEKTALTREYFIEDLHKCVQFAAAHQVTLAIETMDDPFINTLADVAQIKNRSKVRGYRHILI